MPLRSKYAPIRLDKKINLGKKTTERENTCQMMLGKESCHIERPFGQNFSSLMGWKEFTSVWKLSFSMDVNTWETLQVIRIVIFEKFEKNL